MEAGSDGQLSLTRDADGSVELGAIIIGDETCVVKSKVVVCAEGVQCVLQVGRKVE